MDSHDSRSPALKYFSPFEVYTDGTMQNITCIISQFGDDAAALRTVRRYAYGVGRACDDVIIRHQNISVNRDWLLLMCAQVEVALQTSTASLLVPAAHVVAAYDTSTSLSTISFTAPEAPEGLVTVSITDTESRKVVYFQVRFASRAHHLSVFHLHGSPNILFALCLLTTSFML